MCHTNEFPKSFFPLNLINKRKKTRHLNTTTPATALGTKKKCWPSFPVITFETLEMRMQKKTKKHHNKIETSKLNIKWRGRHIHLSCNWFLQLLVFCFLYFLLLLLIFIYLLTLISSNLLFIQFLSIMFIDMENPMRKTFSTCETKSQK